MRLVLVVLGLAAWFGTQSLLGARPAPAGPEAMETASDVVTRGDAVLGALSGVHRQLSEQRWQAHAVLISSSLMIDALGLFLLGWSIFGRSLRPFVGLLILFGLRQLMQSLSLLPPPIGMIWEDPGFPSLLVTYSVANDMFFSGHTALAVYGSIELWRLGGPWWRTAAVIAGVYLTMSVLLLRAHYSMDVYAGAITAAACAQWARQLAPKIDALAARLAPAGDEGKG